MMFAWKPITLTTNPILSIAWYRTNILSRYVWFSASSFILIKYFGLLFFGRSWLSTGRRDVYGGAGGRGVPGCSKGWSGGGWRIGCHGLPSYFHLSTSLKLSWIILFYILNQFRDNINIRNLNKQTLLHLQLNFPHLPLSLLWFDFGK